VSLRLKLSNYQYHYAYIYNNINNYSATHSHSIVTQLLRVSKCNLSVSSLVTVGGNHNDNVTLWLPPTVTSELTLTLRLHLLALSNWVTIAIGHWLIGVTKSNTNSNTNSKLLTVTVTLTVTTASELLAHSQCEWHSQHTQTKTETHSYTTTTATTTSTTSISNSCRIRALTIIILRIKYYLLQRAVALCSPAVSFSPLKVNYLLSPL